MSKWKPGAIVIAFVLVIVGQSSFFDPPVTRWIDPLGAAAFVWAYVTYANGRASEAFAWVVVLTVLFPMTVLAAILFTGYSSWSSLKAAVVHDLIESGDIWNFIVPLIAALAVVPLVRKHAP